MKNLKLLTLGLASIAFGASSGFPNPFHSSTRIVADGQADFEYERIDRNNAALLIVDHQTGLFSVVRDFSPAEFSQQILAHAALGRMFDLPTIITTSTETGPNGPVPEAILEMHPNATIIPRPGEINAWDNDDFRAAVEATGKRHLIIGGIVTDACTVTLALALRDAGYSVWANVEASGTTATLLRDVSNSRMERAGVQLLSWFGIVAELWADWRNPPGSAAMLEYMAEHFPVYTYLIQSHEHAVLNGTLFDDDEE
ncbi:hypothetical protein S7711_06103 [Stachybotrys chartarum IBT 7711]|uniref:Isochorismatase-like domain-containing protein n=1 Tax=Stachybotrys chartarum (strain CBS 109288 / IBT 7711) TaxID=1280523 RepID=A0A084B8L7_STACB|nr:hypothetical protein S7711_06103 [Stachybotrys chartarum IBT 7711]KFA80907.1 hypothetical protein S40288_07988 [Stachybotrys chartarum IBT 40288]